MAKFEPSSAGRFRKPQKGKSGKIVGIASETGRKLAMGRIGLKVLEGVRLTPGQLESMRKVLVNKLGRYMVINFRVFAHKAITAKPIAVRMGGGKGGNDHYVAIVKPGQIVFEVDGEKTDADIKNAIEAAAKKIGCATKIVEMGVF